MISHFSHSVRIHIVPDTACSAIPNNALFPFHIGGVPEPVWVAGRWIQKIEPEIGVVSDYFPPLCTHLPSLCPCPLHTPAVAPMD